MIFPICFFFLGNPICPVKTFELCVSKLDPRCNSLWQKPRHLKSLLYADAPWYEPRPVGHTLLEKFMGTLSEDLELSYHYTNHCIHATGMTLLNEKGFEARHFCAVSSHKNEAMIRNYAVKCPDTKKREISESLASALMPKEVPEKIQKVDMPPAIPEDPMLQDIDWENDDMLVKILEKIEKENAALTPVSPPEKPAIQLQAAAPAPVPSVFTVQNNIANIRTPGPRFPPMMYFSHSNVTINYHMHQ